MEMLQKNVEELESEDNGEGAAQHPIQCGVLVEKGYQGAEGIIRTIQPKRQPRGSELSHQDVARSRLVSTDRVLVENFYGRVCMLWKAMYVTYNSMSLRNDDNVRYLSVTARYESMADEAKQKRARSQKAYRLRRDERLAAPARSPSTRRNRLSSQRPAPYRRPAHDEEETQLSQAF
ncbi:unnamed protein product [Phytophthora fragariaefolia]|uniref:Unnamed protein product n=1 Tax=Phytophthora fragariaefolia TaxID=1490495 RepID=A0A9W7CLL4_9STRA|nr:unnamed protein product [Phytophthora fragariaefolia]